MGQLWRVIGPPGAGKSTYLSRQAVRAVQQHGHQSVAICSLTQTAAAAIAAKVDLPDRHVATLHAHALRSLGNPDLAEGKEPINEFSRQHPVYRRTVGRGSRDQQTAGDRYHEQAATLRSALVPEHRWPAAVHRYHQTWTAWKRQQGVRDFTDLIAEAAETGLHGGFQVLLVDEAQDLSPLEWQVIQRTAERMHTTVLAGDPAQALFGFRGADPQAMLRLQVDGQRILDTSWRCGQAIIDQARRLLRRHQPLLDVDYHARPGHVGQVLRSRASIQNPQATVHEIRRWLDHGSVMVTATCAHMLRPLISELDQAGILYHNPYQPDRKEWSALGDATPLRSLLAPDPNTFGDTAPPWWTWRHVHHWIAPMRSRTLTRGAKEFVAHKQTRDPITGHSEADLEVEPDTLASLLADGLHAAPLHASPSHWVDWWQQRLKRPATFAPAIRAWHNQPASIAHEPRLILGTMHAVKGGEADTVIVMPDTSRTAWFGTDRPAICRTIYVGLTRARTNLLLGTPSTPEAMTP